MNWLIFLIGTLITLIFICVLAAVIGFIWTFFAAVKKNIEKNFDERNKKNE